MSAGPGTAVRVPPPHEAPFTDGIRHPELWLWDSWVMRTGGALELYCLALARRTRAGRPIGLREFNAYPFHYRRFTSVDDGRSWRDRGAVLHPGNVADGSDAGNVWSGSVTPLEDGRVLFGYTGISHAGPERHFVQSAVFAAGTVDGPDTFPAAAQSHPIRDRAAIVAAGYYLPEDNIGFDHGEGDGPILAWRDPFVIELPDGRLNALWSAKVTDTVPALAHAVLSRGDDGAWSLALQPPITLPDASEYTQAEVPKLCRDADTGELLLMISSCDRLQESQPDSEVSKQLRLYRSADIAGPWRPAFAHGAAIPGTDVLFGASFMDTSASGGRARIVSPYWAAAPDGLPMSIAPVQTVPLGD